MRNEEYQFVSTDATELTADLISAFEAMTGVTVLPASPENLFIRWVANIIVYERSLTNYVGNQNIPSRADGENLDALGEVIYGITRPQAKPSTATVRFRISAPQDTAILIPAGTRVTTRDRILFWATQEDKYIDIGETYADVPVACQTAGTAGNGYVAGQINTIVDVYDYFTSCENTTETDGGSEIATDAEYYELMRASLDSYSCAGSRGGYEYFAKSVSSEISDVIVNSPDDGCVSIYALMADGTPASETIKAAVLAACSADEVRPLTDHVSVEDPAEVEYDITFTYYLSSASGRSAADIAADVSDAVNRYIEWQRARFGRDINPDRLREYLLMIDGVKRIALTAPVFTPLRDGLDNTVPQYASKGTVTVTNGGYEDER